MRRIEEQIMRVMVEPGQRRFLPFCGHSPHRIRFVICDEQVSGFFTGAREPFNPCGVFGGLHNEINVKRNALTQDCGILIGVMIASVGLTTLTCETSATPFSVIRGGFNVSYTIIVLVELFQLLEMRMVQAMVP
jgi:hypothetical protein